MKSTEFHPADYDVHGRLRLPFLFWCVLLLQARAWVLFVIAGSSRGQGNTLLNFFYPDHDNFWLGLLPGVPAVVAFLLSGRREAFPGVWRWLRGLLILAQLVSLCWLPVMWLGWRPGQRRRAGAAAGGHRRADLAVNQSTFACLFFP
ncbi:membrane protein [Salmonella enterica subsp. enterica]|uniref:Membrane protein n=1 Tax=Salmonella enterica I TaxID=59201 RepID=A0A447PCH3_SALET|nr:membrane protein [Salmonella enterica subsp. enterica]